MTRLEGRLSATAGRFATLRQSLHASLASELGARPTSVVGSKEILCEEYVPALVASGVRCIIVLRDPRAVIASANHGRYRDSVGDRYPLLMLVRLWRKSTDYWLRFRDHPLVRAIRYEDLVADPDKVLAGLAGWLGIGTFPGNMAQASLLDHMGVPWQGNSSFGDKATIDGSSADNWRRLLSRAEVRLIEACTRAELAATGYSMTQDVGARDILGYEEDITQVRPAYLARHALNASARATEVRRFDASIATVNECSR